MVKRVSSFLLFSLLSLQAMSAETQIDSHRPKDVVDITTVAPDVQVYMRYFTSYNVIGRPIKGYKAPVCLLTPPAAQRSPDNSLDFGTGFDCFSPLSHPDNALLTAQQRANRLLLQTLMRDAGIIQNGGISPLLMSHTRRLGLTFPLRREPQTTLC
ncbi:D-alanyl-D-alanine dipeptidase [Salmonella enterica subsp. arizonae]|nr:D-alanyl-D-alanine dipeptidase [Salmonella enterica subsp. arizonae]